MDFGQVYALRPHNATIEAIRNIIIKITGSASGKNAFTSHHKFECWILCSACQLWHISSAL